MLSIRTHLYTGLGWLVAATAFSCHMILVMLSTPFVKNRERFSILATRPFIKAGFWVLRFKLSVSGVDHIPKTGPFIIVANHFSHVDILAFLIALPRVANFVAKKELLNVPILGWDIRSQGHIAIDRKNPVQAKNMLTGLISSIKSDQQNLVIFAEGTRSSTGKIGKFKLGAFDLAAKSGAVIVPASINGTFEILSKKTPHMKPGPIQITFYPPITVGSTDMSDLEHARDVTKRSVEQGVN